MSGRKPPADMLLMLERQRRLRSSPTPHAAQDDELLVESDEIVDESQPREPHASGGGSIALYRPLALVTLAHISWSDVVDHAALQNAIACSPAGGRGGAAGVPSWLTEVTTLMLPAAPRDEASLYVSLAPDEIAMLSRAGSLLSRADASALVLASALPVTIVGVDTATVSPAASVLGAYRRAALVHAWQTGLCGHAGPDAGRARDETAVQLVSTLRALLGEA